MIVDPVEAFKKTTATLPIATSKHTPLPTVIPTPSYEYQKASETGERTLWYVLRSQPPGTILLAVEELHSVAACSSSILDNYILL
jgi:hypothetical protein